MFILRQIDKNGNVFNQSLGEHYSVVTRKQSERFADLMGTGFDSPEIENCYGLVVYCNNSDFQQTWPLYKDYWYYIMTETGKTFDNITNKD